MFPNLEDVACTLPFREEIREEMIFVRPLQNSPVSVWCACEGGVGCFRSPLGSLRKETRERGAKKGAENEKDKL